MFSFAHIQQMCATMCVLCTRFLYYVPTKEKQRDFENTTPMQTDTKVCLSGGKVCTTLCVEPPPQSISDDFDAVDYGKSLKKSRNHGKNPGQVGISPSTPYSKHESFFNIFFSTYLRGKTWTETQKIFAPATVCSGVKPLQKY